MREQRPSTLQSFGSTSAVQKGADEYLALKAVEIVVDSILLLATSPLQAGALTISAVGVATYALDSEGRAAQMVASLYVRFLVSLDGISLNLASLKPASSASLWSPNSGAVDTTGPAIDATTSTMAAASDDASSVTSSSSHTSTASSAKEVSSWRIPNEDLRRGCPDGGNKKRDRRRHARSNNNNRGRRRDEGAPPPNQLLDARTTHVERRAISLDVPRSSPTRNASLALQHQWQRQRPRPKQSRRSSVDVYQSSRAGASSPACLTSRKEPHSAEGAGRMHRIASGQQLSTLGLGVSSADCEHRSGMTTTGMTLPGSRDNAALSQEDSFSESPTWTSDAATAVAWLLPTAKQTLAWSSASASATLSSSLPSLSSVVESLRRLPSAPAGWPSLKRPSFLESRRGDDVSSTLEAPSSSSSCSTDSDDDDAGGPGPGTNAVSTASAGYDRRRRKRSPLADGHVASAAPHAVVTALPCNRHEASRYYSHGVVTARSPSHREALERYACAARPHQTAGGAMPTSLTAGVSPPGHVAIQGAKGAETSALASLGLDGDCPQAIRDVVSDEMLLQLGTLLGEPASEAALRHLNLPGAVESSEALLGAQDIAHATTSEWEMVVAEEASGLRVKSWRLPLKRGLYVYLTRAVLEGVAPRDVRAFYLDDEARALWDDSAIAIHRILDDGGDPTIARDATTGGGQSSSRHPPESCMHRYVSRFPRPMAAREYRYARRVWHRPSDGGCYVVCRSCDFPPQSRCDAQEGGRGGGAAAAGAYRAVHVTEYVSCTSVKACENGESTEMVSVYFEDSQVSPKLAKMAVPKGLWPFWQKYDAALRLFAGARRAAHGRNVRRSHDGGAEQRYRHRMEREREGERSQEEYDSCAFHGHEYRDYHNDGLNEEIELSSHVGYRCDGGDVSECESDEEAYALAALRAQKRRGNGSVMGSSSRWARRLIIAGAVRMVQIMMATS